ncbi:MAG: TIGR02147 family protein [Bdellovibrionota bacterium]
MQKSINEQQLEFRVWLQDEFSRRCRTNSSYSLRAFAKHLEFDSSTLSQILAGKRKISDKVIQKISTKIGRPPTGLTSENDSSKYMLLSMDAFTVISDWYHYAIMDLTLVKKFKNDPSWIAQQLQISSLEAKLAVERLLRLGMLVQKNGKLKLSKITNTNYIEGQTSSAHKEYQRQVITKALHAVDNCPQEKKDITSMTIAANSKKIIEAKEKIKKFRRELCKFLEDGEKDSVYQLGVQLYPLTKFEL